MVNVEVTAGVCGFKTKITAEGKGSYKACFHLESGCPSWQKIEKKLGGVELNIMAELFKDKKTREVNSQVIKCLLENIPHISCPVASAILKALEVATRLALPKDAEIKFI